MEVFIYCDSADNPLVMLEIQFWVRANTAENSLEEPWKLFWKRTAIFLAALLCVFGCCQGQLWAQMKSQAAQGRVLQKAAEYCGYSVSSVCDSSPVCCYYTQAQAFYYTCLTKRQKVFLLWGKKNTKNTNVFPLLPHSSPRRYVYIKGKSSETVKHIYIYISKRKNNQTKTPQIMRFNLWSSN